MNLTLQKQLHKTILNTTTQSYYSNKTTTSHTNCKNAIFHDKTSQHNAIKPSSTQKHPYTHPYTHTHNSSHNPLSYNDYTIHTEAYPIFHTSHILSYTLIHSHTLTHTLPFPCAYLINYPHRHIQYNLNKKNKK